MSFLRALSLLRRSAERERYTLQNECLPRNHEQHTRERISEIRTNRNDERKTHRSDSILTRGKRHFKNGRRLFTGWCERVRRRAVRQICSASGTRGVSRLRGDDVPADRRTPSGEATGAFPRATPTNRRRQTLPSVTPTLFRRHRRPRP